MPFEPFFDERAVFFGFFAPNDRFLV